MLVVRATKKLLDRLGPVTLESGQTSTTRLGDWYASAWAWRPQVALFVSEATLFPILMPLAPPRSWLASPTASPRRWRPTTSLRRSSPRSCPACRTCGWARPPAAACWES